MRSQRQHYRRKPVQESLGELQARKRWVRIACIICFYMCVCV